MSEKPAKTLGEMKADSVSNGNGIECPTCGCRDFRTYGTDPKNTATFRYKQCRHCGHRIVTATPHSRERIVRDVNQRADGDGIIQMLGIG